MRKKNLLALPEVTISDDILQMVREDQGREVSRSYTYYQKAETIRIYSHYVFFTVRRDGDILQIGVFQRSDVARGQQAPKYRVFLSKEEHKWITLETGTGRWLTAMLENLYYNTEEGWYMCNETWASNEDRELANEFTGYPNTTLREAVRRWQGRWKHNSEIVEIDTVMEAVPDLPKDWDAWAMADGFWTHQYFLYHYKRTGREGYCTGCREWVQAPVKPKHNTILKCPKCGRKLLCKSWDRQETLEDRMKLGIIQELTTGGGYILRELEYTVTRRRSNFYKPECAGGFEWRRVALNKYFQAEHSYYFGDYKNQHFDRWCYDCGYYAQTDIDVVLYPKNLKEVMAGYEEVKYIPWELIFGKGCYTEVARSLRGCRIHPKAMEMLGKFGLGDLARELADGRNIHMDESKNTPWGILQIEKDQLKLCQDMDINEHQLSTLHECNKYRFHPDEEQLRFLAKHLGPAMVGRVLELGHTEKVLKYLGKMQGGRQIADYMDYLHDLQFMGLPRTKDNIMPCNFQTQHIELAQMRIEREQKLASMELKKKNEEFRELVPTMQRLYQIEDENMIIVVPKSKADFQKEGQNQHNCVGGIYFDKVLKGQSTVFFIRKKEDPEKSFCTVEVRGDKIIQNRAAYNKDAPQEAKDFMKLVVRHYQEEMRKMAEETLMEAAV